MSTNSDDPLALQSLTTAVRFELGDTDQSLDADLVEYHTKKAKSWVLKRATTSDEEDQATAIALEGAYRLVTTNKDAFLSSKGAADVDKSWNASEFISALSDRRDEAIEDVTSKNSPSLSTVGGPLRRR